MSIDPAQIAAMLGVATPDIQERVNVKINQTLNRLEHELHLAKPLTPPVVLYDLKGTTAGQAIHHVNAGTQVIRLNLPALQNPEFRDYMLATTVPHEVVHCAEYQLYGAAGHGYNFQRLMLLLGLPPDRTHDLPLPKARKTQKWAYRCECRTHYISTTKHNRISRGQQTYYCKYCRGELR